MSMRLLLMLVLWLTNRPTASSCAMSQENLSHSLQAPVGFLGNTFRVSSAVIVFCCFRAHVSGYQSPFTALSWIRAGTASQKFHICDLLHLIYYLHLNTPRSPPLIARNVLTLYVHSSPSSPSATCTPSVDAVTTRIQNTSCSIISDEEVSTTVETHHRHLPYCHPRLAFPLSDETGRVVLNPCTHISIGSPSRDSLASESSPASRSSLGVRSSSWIVIERRDDHSDLLFCCGINNSLHPSSLGLPSID